ncbi:DNA-processing protein DprA [Tumidithrix helvetica PCC 7403]|uniref:DNA-processing protein DprA n=1 Tax=Tumidithrix helvetica TaxID=3457545 RepID=UPI003C96CFF8
MERAYWLAWSTIYGIGSVLLKRIYLGFGSLEAAWKAPIEELAEIEGLGKQVCEAIQRDRLSLDPQQLLTEYLSKNPDFWTPADPEYPKLLWEIPDPPPILYYRGNLKSWSERYTVGIVGTRSPTGYGRRWTKKIAQALAERGFTVVSGLADGVDAEAHLGCLGVQGQTIAVVGTGVDRVYPPRNQSLYQKILETGLVLSEYPQGTPPDRAHFPKRNRIIAGLCRATIVIEAPERSGALITAHQANDYNREVFALPGSLDVEQAKGCLNLIDKGAQIILGIDELLAALGMLPQLDSGIEPVQLALLDPTQQKILEAIGFDEAVSFDRIIEQVNLPSGEVSGALLQMELLGAIAQVPGMRYQRLT